MKFRSLFVVLILALSIGSACTKKSLSKVDEIMTADKGFNFPPSFPPDPGEVGKKTLEGIDSDHDGLRDDLKRWIYARFPNEPKKRAALKQLAVSYQKTLFLSHDEKEMKENSKRDAKSSRCLYDTFPPDEAHREAEYMQAKALNTKLRTQRYLEVNRWFDGMTLGPSYPEDGSACEN